MKNISSQKVGGTAGEGGVGTLSFFFFYWVFFHDHSRITGLQGKEEGIFLTPHYHFYPLHRHLDISWAITVESSLLHIAGLEPGASRYPLSYKAAVAHPDVMYILSQKQITPISIFNRVINSVSDLL